MNDSRSSLQNKLIEELFISFLHLTRGVVTRNDHQPLSRSRTGWRQTKQSLSPVAVSPPGK